MNELLTVLISGLLADNIVCHRCIGIVGGEFSLTTFRSSLFYSLWVTLISLVSTAVCYPLQKYVFTPWGVPYFYIALTAAVTAALVFLMDKLKKGNLFSFNTVQKTVIFASALGICNLCLGISKYYLALVAALAYGIGLLLTLLIFFCARLSLKHTRVPKLLQNTAIDLIIVAIISLLFHGFQ